MYSEEQILLLKHFKLDKITLHFDATGSVVRKIERTEDISILCVNNCQTPKCKNISYSISRNVKQRSHQCRDISFLKAFSPAHIEIDFSWQCYMDSTNGSMSTMSEIFEIMTVSSSHWLTIICTKSAFYSINCFIIMAIIIFGHFLESDIFVSEAPLYNTS